MAVAIVSGWFGTHPTFERRVPRRCNGPYDYFFYTDNEVAFDVASKAGWRAIRVDCRGSDGVMCGKFYKMQPHRLPELAEYEVAVWIDNKRASLRRRPLERAIKELQRSECGILMYQNFTCGGYTNSIHTELDCSMYQPRYRMQETLIRDFVKSRTREGYEDVSDRFLWAGNIIYLLHDPKARMVLDRWYETTLDSGIIQDQILLHYLQQDFRDVFYLCTSPYFFEQYDRSRHHRWFVVVAMTIAATVAVATIAAKIVVSGSR